MALMLAALAAASPVACVAVDGDTLRCGAERVRLLGIDAPEMPGHCRRGRQCVPGDPWQSKAALVDAVRGPVTLRRHGRDVYGRTLAIAEVAGRDLACEQLAGGHAVYKAAYDRRGLVRRRCETGRP